MKKSLVVLAIIVFTFSLCGTALAAAISNPFVDVPKGHWSYGAVKKLVDDGIVDGVDGKFYGDKTLSRYEMSVIVAKALAKEDKANAEEKALIEKLAAEYRNELESIGVRLNAMEAKTEKVQYYGYLGFRYNDVKVGSADTTVWAAHFDGNISFKVDDKTKIGYEFASHRDLTSGAAGSSSNYDYNGMQLYVNTTGIDKINLTAGRFNLNPAYDMVVSSNDYQGAPVRGAKIDFGGNVVGASLFAGKIDGTYGLASTTFNYGNYYMAEADYKVSRDTTVKAAYHYFKPEKGSYSTLSTNGDSVNFVELGFDTKLNKDFSFQAAADKSSTDGNNKGYFAQLMYKQSMFWAVPHSYDVFVAYHDTPANSTINGGLVSDFYGGVGYDFKGMAFGAHYTPVRMQQLTMFCYKGKDITSNADKTVYRAQYDFFF